MDRMMHRFARYLLNTLTQQQKQLELSFIKKIHDRDIGFLHKRIRIKNLTSIGATVKYKNCTILIQV